MLYALLAMSIELLKNITLHKVKTCYTSPYKGYVMSEKGTQQVAGRGGGVRMPHPRIFLSSLT